MNILGLSCFYHDSAACLVRDGEIVAASQEERFTRKKHDQAFPIHAIQYCLREGGLRSAQDLDCVGYYEIPYLRFERILATFLDAVPRGYAAFKKVIPLWMGQKLWIERILRDSLSYSGPIIFCEHHQSHAASAFFPSPFSDAAILTLDGVGEWAAGSWGIGEGNRIQLHEEIHYPHSLGLLYSAFTYYLGFKVNSGEYKVMGLAPYGQPRHVETILTRLVDLRDDGSFHLDMRCFDFSVGLTMTNDRFAELFGGPRRLPEAPLEPRHLDIARSIQEVTNLIVLRMARYVKKQTGRTKLCMAGGVAFNCVANGVVARERVFEQMWIQPAAGDAGAALGVALYVWFQENGHARVMEGTRDLMRGALLGPAYSNEEIQRTLERYLLPYKRLTREELPTFVAQLIAGGAVVGWFQGRMEFGPRALGARSILGDPRSRTMQSNMNQKIKFRESFRPFAPSVLAERATEFFELDGQSPYMLFVVPLQQRHLKEPTGEERTLEGLDRLKRERSSIPAVTHVDGSARVQTVASEDNPLFAEVLQSFGELTGHPLVVNTSFNVRGEPICCTPDDAVRCFLRTDMDALVIGSFVLDKANIPKPVRSSERPQEFEAD